MTDQTQQSPATDTPAVPAVGHILAPDVGALVEYGTNSFGTEPGRYRVSGWLRAAPPPTLDPDDFIGKILFESCPELRDASDGQRKRMQFCLREEATHLSLSGICGAIAPIEMCKVTGMVDWKPELLEQERELARRMGAAHQMIL